MKSRFAALAVLLALAGCHNQPTAGGLSPDDERELDNAAAMLDQQNIFDTSPESFGVNGVETTDLTDNGAGAAVASTNRSANRQ